METIEQFDERHDILIYVTVAEEYKIFAASQKLATGLALELCKRKWRDRMVVKFETVPLTAACYKCLDDTEHPWHDNGDYNEN